MKKFIIASTSHGAGKTSVILGLARAMGNKIAYLKPLGDRLLYKKKRQWDYDSAVITGLCGIEENPETMTIGFEHSKLRYMYDEEGLKGKLAEIMESVQKGKDVMLIEAGKTLTCGMSVNLDPISLVKHVGGTLITVVSGSDDDIVDDITFLKKYVNQTKVDFGGVIINKVKDKDDFEETYLSGIDEMGVKVLGMIPYQPELTHFSVSYLSDKLFAKVIAGEQGLTGRVRHIVVGAMSAEAVQQMPLFGTEEKLVITSGDRSDMILAALETKASAVVLTNNILPPANIVSKASELGIPLLLVKADTFAAAKLVDDMEPLTTPDDEYRAKLLGQLIHDNIKLNSLS